MLYSMRQKRNDPDHIGIRQKKGAWLRFIKLFPKCRLPWVWLAIYVLLSITVVNVGINETTYTAEFFAGNTSAALLLKLVVVILINMVSTSILVLVGNITSARINRNMREVVFGKVLRLPMSFFKDENPREAVSRITQNSVMIESTIMLVIMPLFTAGYTAIAVLGNVFKYDWRLSLILLAFIPLQILIAFLFGRLNYSVRVRETALKSTLTQKLAELITNIPLAKVFAKEDQETANGEELVARLYKVSIKSSWLSQLQNLSETCVSLLQSIVLVFVGVLLFKDQAITKRAWIAFFAFSSVFSGAISQFMTYWHNLKVIQGGADRVAEIMDAQEEDRSGEPCENLVGDIILEHVSFGYDKEKRVLTDVSCEFKDNCVTALLGVSGCGKTTLVNLLTRLYPVDSGEIIIGGKAINSYALEDYRSQFVVVSQNAMLFSGTIGENVCYGNENVSEERLNEALKQAGAFEFVNDFPDGVQTRLEEYGNNLSGGQRQRLAMARALLSDAHYLILDEPAASMDAIAASELMDILKNISKGRCMIVIAHTAAVLPLSDRVVIIENGAVSAQGEISEVQTTNDFLREFSGKQVSV